MAEIQIEKKPASENCPLCREALDTEETRTCELCGTCFHAECQVEFGGGCPTTGCAGAKPAARPRQDARVSEELQPYQTPPRPAQTFLSLLLMATGAFALIGSLPAFAILSKRHPTAGPLLLLAGLLLVFGGWLAHPQRRL